MLEGLHHPPQQQIIPIYREREKGKTILNIFGIQSNPFHFQVSHLDRLILGKSLLLWVQIRPNSILNGKVK